MAVEGWFKVEIIGDQIELPAESRMPVHSEAAMSQLEGSGEKASECQR